MTTVGQVQLALFCSHYLSICTNLFCLSASEKQHLKCAFNKGLDWEGRNPTTQSPQDLYSQLWNSPQFQYAVISQIAFLEPSQLESIKRREKDTLTTSPLLAAWTAQGFYCFSLQLLLSPNSFLLYTSCWHSFSCSRTTISAAMQEASIEAKGLPEHDAAI